MFITSGGGGAGEEGVGGVGEAGVRGKAPRQINHRLGCSTRRWRMMIGEERRQLLDGRQRWAIRFSFFFCGE